MTELKKTFQMRELYNSNIDFLLDFYEDQEENEENADDILDQIATLSREKRYSFQVQSLSYGKSKSTYEKCSPIPEKYDEDSGYNFSSSHTEIPRVYSENLADINRNSCPHAELRFANETPETKVKAKKKRYCPKIKSQSLCTPLLNSKTMKWPIECDTPSPFVSSDSKFQWKAPERNSNTPRRLRGKKLKKRKTKKLVHKIDENSSDGSYEDETKDIPSHQISLFAKDRSNDEIDDSSSSERQKETHENEFQYGPFSTGCIRYEIQQHTGLGKKSKLREKRNSSPFEKNYEEELKKNFSTQANVRLSSSTPSDSDGVCDGDDDSGNMTTCPSKNQHSYLGSLQRREPGI